MTDQAEILARQSALARSLVEASTALDYLDQTGDFRFDGLTAGQWWQIRTRITAEIDQSVIESRRVGHG